MKTFHIVNIGCKVNRVEADTAAAALIDSGWVPGDLEDADLVLVNTCTVTGEADKKSRKAVRQALARNGKAKVIVTGCAVAIDGNEYAELGERVKVELRGELEKRIREKHEPERLIRIGETFNTRVGVKIQDGCNHTCTYCVVRIARCVERSMPHDDAIRQIGGYFAQGVNEIVLTGINIGAYDDGDMRLAELMERLLACAEGFQTPDAFGPRIRLSSIEPRDIDTRLRKLLAASDGRLCRHLHVPMQSGSTKVLRDMNRPYTAEWYADLVAALRSETSALSLSTDIIVGFPGETEAEFEETLSMARACRFSKIHVFPYSARVGTPAAERDDQVPSEVKSDRARRLRELAAELRAQDYANRIGATELVLVEPDHALTESYHEVPVPIGAASGSLIECKLT